MHTQAEVENKLIGVLGQIQRDSGYDSAGICGTTNPFRDLAGFDSQISVAAICELATVLDVDIPNNKNIFVSDDNKQLLTVGEIAKQVCTILSKTDEK